LTVSTPAKVVYAIFATALTFLTFASLPLFDAIGRKSRPALELVNVPVVTAPPRQMTEEVKKPTPRKLPKPKLADARKLNMLAPLKPDTSLATSLALSMTTLQPGLGDVSVDFHIETPRAEAAKPAAIAAFTIRDLDSPPRLVAPVRPLYPLQARQRGIEGYVDIEFEIEPDGGVKTVRAIGAEPPGVFDESACNAARRWRFSVPLKDGKAVKVRARQRVQFKLEK
jgi:protein TonB